MVNFLFFLVQSLLGRVLKEGCCYPLQELKYAACELLLCKHFILGVRDPLCPNRKS